MTAGETPWTAQQREWLRALGHDVFVPVASAAAGARVEEARATPAAAAPATPATRGRAPAAGALLRALARAAAREETDEELRRVLPDLATLHGNPAARRALWPQLRALRKRRRG